ncbi:MAG TPA: GFA family protein [Tabrizicola sp.]
MPETTPPLERVASCECGALRLRVCGNPVHVHGCTCTRCQRSTGSVMKLSAWFPEADVAVEGTFATWHPAGPDAPLLTACFCPTCGGGRFFRSGDYLTGCIGIAVGHFADPGFPAPDHIHFWPDRPHWLGAPLGPLLLEGN